MINLIPPSAKKSITFEYWKRVIAVWLCLFSVALIILAVFLLPTHIALHSQISFLEDSVNTGVDRVSSYDISATELVTTSNRAKSLLENISTNTPSSLITVLKLHAGGNVLLNNFQFTKLESNPSLTLAGVAATRQDLATFRDAVSLDVRFVAVNLPISNLIKDKDLLFSMEMTLATTTGI